MSAQSWQPLIETHTPERSSESITSSSHDEVVTRIDEPTVNTADMNTWTQFQLRELFYAHGGRVFILPIKYNCILVNC